MHPMSLDAPEQAPVTLGRSVPRRYVALGLIGVAIVLVVALVVIRDDDTQSGTSTVETYTPAPVSIIAPLTHIPRATVDAVGVTATGVPITPLTPTGGSPVWQEPTRGARTKPVVFFYGAEFAPYAAAERWPVIAALSRFGYLWPVGLMQSSGSVAFAYTSTFTFWRSAFASRWLDLQSVERYGGLDPTGAGYAPLETPTSRQAAAVALYDAPGTTFPLLDVADRYVLVGSSFAPSVLAGLSQSQIVADLAIPTSPVTEAIVASANEITAAICAVTGERPIAVCHARGVIAADAKLKIPAPG